MTDYLVIVGDVSPEQYKLALAELREQGIVPEVVHCSEPHFLFYGEAENQYRRDRTLTVADSDGQTPRQINPRTARGLVMHESIWVNPDSMLDCWSDDFWNLRVCHVVRPDGSVEFV